VASHIERLDVACELENAIIDIDVPCTNELPQVKADVAPIYAGSQPPFHRDARRFRNERPRRSCREYAADFGADAKGERADPTRVRAVTVVVEIERPGEHESALDWKDVAVPATPCVVELLHAPRRSGFPIECASRNSTLVEIYDIVIRHHHHALGIE